MTRLIVPGLEATYRALDQPPVQHLPEPDFRCPDCGGDESDMSHRSYDYGVDPHTGYHDEGEYLKCPCGWRGQAVELRAMLPGGAE